MQRLQTTFELLFVMAFDFGLAVTLGFLAMYSLTLSTTLVTQLATMHHSSQIYCLNHL